MPTDWSRDGRFLLFSAPGETTNWDIWVLPMEGDRKPLPLVRTPALEGGGTFSPDGKWIAYMSIESGQTNVFAAPFPGPGERVAISTAGGRSPKWRGDGKEIFYLADDGKMMAVPIRTAATIEAGVPVPLFEARAKSQPGWAYDVTPDGQKFIVVSRVSEREVPPFAVIVNWMSGLKAR